jgi:hypothetical protein
MVAKRGNPTNKKHRFIVARYSWARAAPPSRLIAQPASCLSSPNPSTELAEGPGHPLEPFPDQLYVHTIRETEVLVAAKVDARYDGDTGFSKMPSR